MATHRPADASRRSERARTAIHRAALGLTAEVGFAKVTVEAIAARAGVGKQTIYRWWPSKGAVVFDALLAANEDAAGTLDLPDTGDVVADLRGVLRTMVAELTEPANDRLQRAVTAEIQHDRALAGEVVERLLRPQVDAIVARLRRAREVGQLAPGVEPAIIAELLIGPVFHRWLLRTGPLDAAFADTIVDHTVGELSVAGGNPGRRGRAGAS